MSKELDYIDVSKLETVRYNDIDDSSLIDVREEDLSQEEYEHDTYENNKSKIKRFKNTFLMQEASEENVDISDRDKFAEKNFRLIFAFLAKYNLDPEDYFDVASIGFVKAMNIYDETRGKFSTLAYSVMLNEVKMYVRTLKKQPKDVISIYTEMNDLEGITIEDSISDNIDFEEEIVQKVSILEQLQYLTVKDLHITYLKIYNADRTTICDRCNIGYTSCTRDYRRVVSKLQANMPHKLIVKQLYTEYTKAKRDGKLRELAYQRYFYFVCIEDFLTRRHPSFKIFKDEDKNPLDYADLREEVIRNFDKLKNKKGSLPAKIASFHANIGKTKFSLTELNNMDDISWIKSLYFTPIHLSIQELPGCKKAVQHLNSIVEKRNSELNTMDNKFNNVEMNDNQDNIECKDIDDKVLKIEDNNIQNEDNQEVTKKKHKGRPKGIKNKKVRSDKGKKRKRKDGELEQPVETSEQPVIKKKRPYHRRKQCDNSNKATETGNETKRIAVYAGTFDPMTLGHLDILVRASKLFDEVILLIANNASKNPTFTLDERKEIASIYCKELTNVKLETFDGLLANYVEQNNICASIRGIRDTTDFAYEFQMQALNKDQFVSFETVFIPTSSEYAFTSSTTVKNIAKLNGNITKYVHKDVVLKIKEKFNN